MALIIDILIYAVMCIVTDLVCHGTTAECLIAGVLGIVYFRQMYPYKS